MTSEELAKIIGVSRSTVSRVINNYPDIPLETRKKVLDAIKKYNYYPNASARKLAGVKDTTLGLFVLDIKDMEQPHHVILNGENLLYDNNFFAPFISAFIDHANKKLFYVLVSTIYKTSELWKIASAFNEKRIDGSVIIGSNHMDYLKVLKTINIDNFTAFVDVEEDNSNMAKAIYVNINNYKGAFDVVKYLAELGHKDIGIITGSLDKLSGKKRFDGFKDAILSLNLPLREEWIFYGDFMEMSGYEGMKKLLSANNTPTAVFVCNDTMVIGAYRAAAELGLKVPHDISIIGFDDAQFSPHMAPPLTTVNVSLPQVAKIAVDLLIESIGKNQMEPVHKLVDAAIIKRGSCKKI